LNDLINVDPYYPTVKETLLELYEELLSTNPEMPEIRMNSGKLHLLMGNYEFAIKDFKTLLSDVSYKNEALMEISNCYLTQGKYDEIINTFKNINLNNDLNEYLYNLSKTFEEKGLSLLSSELLNLIYQNNSEFKDVANKIKEFQKEMPAEKYSPSVDKKMISLIGDHAIGRYEYMEKIGSGGMGVVHKVFDHESNQIVAMKILREGLTHSGRAIERFFREARIASQLNHRNIINIIDYNISSKGGHCYITMEYVDGPSLREIIEKKFADSKDLVVKDISTCVEYCIQLCDALDATHSQGIIHRDIKPDNIMVNSQGIVKITDFGIVHVDEATFTPTGALIGTPRYMSPEQVLGTSIDARSDIYSVGIILYEVMIGSPPFISGDIAFQQVNIIPTRPKLILADVPEDLDNIIMKCLEKDPERRYQSAQELKASLQTFLNNNQSSATTPTATKT
jgi:tetratricopeptide (TPR) repeat protein